MTSIYVASLADYNAGKHHGENLDLESFGFDYEDVEAEIQLILKASREPFAEEWAIHSFDGFKGYQVGESQPIEEVCAIAEGISEHGEKMAMYLEEDHTRTPDKFNDHYIGAHKDESEYAQEYASSSGAEIEGYFAQFIDWQAVGEDLLQDSEVHSSKEKDVIYVFEVH